MKPVRNERALLACVVALFLARCFVANTIVPPWQGPDETTHVAMAQLLALPNERYWQSPLVIENDVIEFDGKPGSPRAIASVERDVKRQIVSSMVKHRWWAAFGWEVPDPIPLFFTGTYVQPIYYGVAALVLRVLPSVNVEDAYFRLQWLSVCFAVLALVFGWAGTRILFDSRTALGTTTIAALHPQFLLTALTVNPDIMVAAWGGFIWWQLARLATGHRRALSFLLVTIASASAAITKKSAVPLAFAALAIAVVLVVPACLEFWRRHKRVLAGAVVAVVTATTLAALFSDGLMGQLAQFWSSPIVVRRHPDDMTVAAATQYLLTAIDYAWLRAGWEHFPAPDLWLHVVRVLTFVAMCGALVQLFRSQGRVRMALAVAWALLLVQLFAILGPGFWGLLAPAGRYLFAVLAPMMVLLWVGIVGVGSSPRHSYAAIALIATVALLDAVGFTEVLVRAYVPIILGGSGS